MIRTVYIETTIPSYYHETRRSVTARAWREATRKWGGITTPFSLLSEDVP